MITEQDLHPGWRMSNKQYGRYWSMMTDCAKKLHITQAEAREQIHIRAFGENRSAKTINHKADFDKLEAEWAAILKPDKIKPQLRVIDQPDNRIRTKILTEYRACLAVLLPIKYGKVTIERNKVGTIALRGPSGEVPNFYLADKYIKSVLENRFKKTDIKDLETVKRPVRDSSWRTISELEMYRDTVARCVSQARQKIGLTGHELNILAAIPCDCADCRDGIVPTVPCMMQPHHEQELAEPESVLVSAGPCESVPDENSPF